MLLSLSLALRPAGEGAGAAVPSRLHGSRSVHRQRCLHLQRDFLGAACDRASSRCPAQCSGHGSCSVDGCTCDIGYGGDDCSAVRPFARTTAAAGNVLAGLMRRATQDLGARDCSVALANACPENCSGHGVCSLGRCECDPGFGGAAWCGNPCRLRVAQLHALAEARVTPAPACACEASAAQAASLRRRSPRAHPTVRGAARVSTACAGATRDGPGARATASSRSRVHLTWAARLRARPTASAS